MKRILDILARGVGFVKHNPQIIYTLFLVVAIPLAFFFTSEQFLRVASDNQDKQEQNRIGLLQDVFAVFAGEKLDEPEILRAYVRDIASKNDGIVNFQILKRGEGTSFAVVVSLNDGEEGTMILLDKASSEIAGFALGNPNKYYAWEFYAGGTRYWRGIRAIPNTTSSVVDTFMITDISMAYVDTVARKNITNAYLTLGVIILLIIGLLARQARIIDYATLYARLKEVDGMKDDFVAMAAHELRSPLTVIRGYAEMLGEGEGLSEGGKGHLRNIEHAAVQLNSLIGDILDVSKLQEGRMSFRFIAVDPTTVITEVVDSFKRPAEDKSLQLFYEATPLPTVSLDIDRFRQVMVNLVGNAIKYTPKGEVRVTQLVADGRVSIRVSDTGMGISAEEQQKLFQKFYRVKNEETQRITGTGLGLWITLEMVKNMKGTISVESIRGKGTDFILSFPVETGTKK